MLTAVAVVATSCEKGIEQEASLLPESGQRGGYRTTLAGDAADNGRCHVCHINYDEEELALNHEMGGVSYEGCYIRV